MNPLKKLFLIFLVLSAVGCARTLILLAPEDLYALGNYHMDEGNYRAAADQFEHIRSDYPTSEYSTMSQFKLAESLFLRENYSKASIEFELFLEFNPAHKLAPQAHYFLAMSKFNSIISPERDTTIALEAKTSLEQFLKRYPNHPDSSKVLDFLHKIVDHLQMHEIEVGRAYYRMGLYESTLNRMVPILKTEASDQVKQEAMYYIGRALLRTGEKDKAKEYFEQACALKTDSEFKQRSQRALRRF